MTTESREKFVKVVGKKLEEGRISVRSSREETWADIQKKEKDGKISEDDKFRFKEEMEKIIKEANETLDALAQKKEREILG
jgi:ribosome recycling factor